MHDQRLLKVDILIQQKKYGQAEKFLKDIISEEPDDVYALYLMAEVILQQNRFPEAENLIDRAIALSPDSPYLYYFKSRTALAREAYEDALKWVDEAIALDPSDADYLAWKGNLMLMGKRYQEAVDWADRALQSDPQNLSGLNVRSAALLKLNRKEESFATLDGALREDPENSYTHANYGWALLEKGDREKSLDHFREALKNDPGNLSARSGMVQALKADYLFYRWFLNYSFFMAKLTKGRQWMVIIGFYLISQTVKGVMREHKELEPFLLPVLCVLVLIAISSWLITPISNVLLRFHPYGRFLLNREDLISSNCMLACIVLGALLFILSIVTSDSQFMIASILSLVMMVPLSSMFDYSTYRFVLPVYNSVLVLLGIGSVALSFTTGAIINALTIAFGIGVVIYLFLANYLRIRENNV